MAFLIFIVSILKKLIFLIFIYSIISFIIITSIMAEHINTLSLEKSIENEVIKPKVAKSDSYESDESDESFVNALSLLEKSLEDELPKSEISNFMSFVCFHIPEIPDECCENPEIERPIPEHQESVWPFENALSLLGKSLEDKIPKYKITNFIGFINFHLVETRHCFLDSKNTDTDAFISEIDDPERYAQAIRSSSLCSESLSSQWFEQQRVEQQNFDSRKC